MIPLPQASRRDSPRGLGVGTQLRLVIQLGVTLPAELAAGADALGAGPLLLMTVLLFACSLISFGVGAPTGVLRSPTPTHAPL